jgi:homoserine kinase
LIESVSARVPASSANLGPGFDCLGVALSLGLELEVTHTGQFSVVSPCDDLPRDRSNLCVKAFETLASSEGLRFRIHSEIPVSAGLGSSAAAIVAGVVCANAMYGLGASVAEHAVSLEGHPDNVLASLCGGFVVGTQAGAVNIEPPAGLGGVVAIPASKVETEAARRAMPEKVLLSDAVENIGNVAKLVLGLERGDLDLVADSLRDRIHQPRRAHLYPRSMELVAEAARFGALGATVSGAGPAVLFWTQDSRTPEVVEAVTNEAPDCVIKAVAFVAGRPQVRAG